MQVKRKPPFPIGIDEAGRGAWAGPVFAACFRVLEPTVAKEAWYLRLTDSKKLSPRLRDVLFAELEQSRLAGRTDFAVASASASEIDRFGIREANRLAMARALGELLGRSEAVIPPIRIDGRDNYRFPELGNPDCEFVVRGDFLHKEISAASVLAKVSRDRHMAAIPCGREYAFGVHKGYGTALHRERLQKLGVSPEHRASYAPIKNLQTTSKDL